MELPFPIKAILALFFAFIILFSICFSTCIVGRSMKSCPLPYYSLDNCIKSTLEIEDLNQIDDSTNQTGIELCDEPQKKAEARPTCKGNLTFINDYKWKKLFNLEAKTIKGYHRIEEGNLYHVRNIELSGSCCLAIYNNYNFRGLKHTMMPGFNIVPKFVKILSFKFGYCNGVS